ncbi:MAG TPA: glycoside hydrolase family 88 protein [Bacillota bacterium]|nr:glycoside hydrolase family 88 protein [Bacillota bacterium]
MANQEWSVQITESVLPELKSLLQDQAALDKAWHYETGCILKAIEQVWLKTKDERYYQLIHDLGGVLVSPEGKIRGYTIEEYNLDQINPGKILFSLLKQSGDERYHKALRLLSIQMKGHPRTRDGGFWHKKVYPYQMWLDGLYMEGPFLAEFAKTFNEPGLYDEVASQLLLVERHTRDPISGLLYHGWDESKEQKWANPQTGCSPHFWGRAMGWYAMAIVDVLDYLPVDHPKRGEIIGIFDRMITALVKVQDPETGLWRQILDQGNRPGNYLEASCSCMFVYALFKGIRLNYVSQNFQAKAEKGYTGIINNLAKVDQSGKVILQSICGCAGLGGDPYRDGSYEYYIQEPVRVNDYKGLAPFILASLEQEQMGGS